MTTTRESNKWLRAHNIRTGNTKVRFHDGRTIVRLHSTDIVDVDTTDNTITLNTGGWNTVTTKERMNAVLSAFNSPYRVHQRDFQWYVQLQYYHCQYCTDRARAFDTIAVIPLRVHKSASSTCLANHDYQPLYTARHTNKDLTVTMRDYVRCTKCDSVTYNVKEVA
jgi:hypothetical protein